MGVAIAMGVAALAGGVMASQSAEDAADAQVGASREATQLQKQMFEESRADQLPWLTRGNQAGDLLSRYLGLPGADPTYGVGAAPTLAQFTKQVPNPAGSGGYIRRGGQGYDPAREPYQGYLGPSNTPNLNATIPVVDQVGYQQALSDYNAKVAAAQKAAQTDPRFGSLLKPFTGADLENEPGYQFGLKQGEGAITDQRAALGSLLSGATLKDLIQYGTDYGGTKFNDAFQRDQATKTLTANLLSGQSGTGQIAATNLGNQSATVGNQLGENRIGAGNARASGYVGASNAINAGIGGAANTYLSSQMLKSLYPQPGTTTGGGGSAPYANRM